MFTIIVAMDKNNLIGKGNELPWHLPEDLKYFKEKTIGNTIIMGRKTYQSIGRPLPRRRNIVLSRNHEFLNLDDIETYTSVEDAIKSIPSHERAFVIGGSNLYQQFLPYVDEMYITKIDHGFEGDTHFPSFNEEEWKVVSITPGTKDESNPYDYSFIHLSRNR